MLHWEFCARKIFLSIERIVFSLLFLFLGNVSFAQIKGGVLKSSVNDRTLEVSFIAYYDCGFKNIPNSDFVSLFDTLAKGSGEYLKLEKISEKEVYPTVAGPCKNLNACFIEVLYQGKVENINPLPDGYFIGWNYCCLPQLTNYKQEGSAGLTLSNYITYKDITEGNNAPAVIQPPFLKGCPTYENRLFFNVIDTVDGDEVSIKKGQVYSEKSKIDLINNQRMAPDGTLGISSPPYHKLNFKEGFQLENPLGENSLFAVVDSTKEIIIDKANQGTYLLKYNLTEKRDSREINSMQLFTITEIK